MPHLWYLAPCVGTLRPYAYHLAVAFYLTICLYADAHATAIIQQEILGLLTFAFLYLATRFSPPWERRQVWLLVGIATCVELFCSLLWGLYRYRFGNVPLYVPPGHGLIYLFALRWARTPWMAAHSRQAKRAALACAIFFAAAGVSVEPILLGRWDVAGALLLPIFAWFLRRPSAPVFVGAFLATSALEIVGTSFGNWMWMASAPYVHIPVGNPPSVIAGGYCLLDFTTLQVARWHPPSLPGWRLRRHQLRPQSGGTGLRNLTRSDARGAP